MQSKLSYLPRESRSGLSARATEATQSAPSRRGNAIRTHPPPGAWETPLTVVNWIRWNSTELASADREELLGAMRPEQQCKLLRDDYVWVGRSGVLWRPVEGGLRRARFTHGAQFETRRGAFRIDATGEVQELPPRPRELQRRGSPLLARAGRP